MVDKKVKQYYWIIGVISITLISLFLLIYFIIVPSFKSISRVNKELKDNKENLQVLEDKLEKLKDFKVKEDELKEQSMYVYRAIPNKKEIGDVFIVLSSLQDEVGDTKTEGFKSDGSPAVTPQTPQQNTQTEESVLSDVKTLQYKSEVTFPSYQSFKDMLKNSEKALRFVHLNKFKITNTQSFTVELSFKAYYREESSQSGGSN